MKEKNPIQVGIPKEHRQDENRVAVVPSTLPSLTKAGLEVVVEAGAGLAAGYGDEEYKEKGAKLVSSREEVFASEVLLQVNTMGTEPDGGTDWEALRDGHIVLGLANPLGNPQTAKKYAEKGATLLAMELIPRITRAQSMDALSSMASLAGYKAVILAAERLPKIFPMMMTAAGSMRPARAFIIGAGVAGLQAIATARRLGAVIKSYDVRPDVKEQVESLGATFVELPLDTEEAQDKGGYAKALGEEFYRKQRELMKEVLAESDVVITTAAIPGKKAPLLVTKEMVEVMPRGAVLVDLAAETGGNCELTEAGKNLDANGVTIMGPQNIPSSIPYHASQMYAKNVSTLLLHLMNEGKLEWDMEDEITKGTLVSHKKEIVHARVKEALGG